MRQRRSVGRPLKFHGQLCGHAVVFLKVIFELRVQVLQGQTGVFKKFPVYNGTVNRFRHKQRAVIRSAVAGGDIDGVRDGKAEFHVPGRGPALIALGRVIQLAGFEFAAGAFTCSAFFQNP